MELELIILRTSCRFCEENHPLSQMVQSFSCFETIKSQWQSCDQCKYKNHEMSAHDYTCHEFGIAFPLFVFKTSRHFFSDFCRHAAHKMRRSLPSSNGGRQTQFLLEKPALSPIKLMQKRSSPETPLICLYLLHLSLRSPWGPRLPSRRHFYDTGQTIKCFFAALISPRDLQNQFTPHSRKRHLNIETSATTIYRIFDV